MKNKKYKRKEVDIDSKIEINFDKTLGTFHIDVKGMTKNDDLYLRMNKFGSGVQNIEPQPIFAIVDSINKELVVFPLEKNNYSENKT